MPHFVISISQQTEERNYLELLIGVSTRKQATKPKAASASIPPLPSKLTANNICKRRSN